MGGVCLGSHHDSGFNFSQAFDPHCESKLSEAAAANAVGYSRRHKRNDDGGWLRRGKGAIYTIAPFLLIFVANYVKLYKFCNRPRRGVEQLAARKAHNLEVVGSSPTPATNHNVPPKVAKWECRKAANQKYLK